MKEKGLSRVVCYWDKVDSEKGLVYLAAIDEGLVYCSTPGGKEDEMIKWVTKHLPDYALKEGSNNILDLAKKQLIDYFKRKGRILDVPMHFIGTSFQKSVWNALTTIPYGKTKTYGQIAASIGKPKAPRAVGGANNKNPIALFVP